MVYSSFRLQFHSFKGRNKGTNAVWKRKFYFFLGNDSPFLNTSRAALIILSS